MQVSQRIPIADISRFIGEHTTLFGKTFVLNSFRTTISNYSKNAAVYMLGNETIVNEQVSTFEGICQRMTTGMAVGSTCSKCAKSVDTEDAIKVFQCSHMYHVGCLPRNEDHEHERCP